MYPISSDFWREAHLLPHNKKHRNRTGTPRIYPAFRKRSLEPDPGGSYYVTRNGSSLIAFTIPAGSWSSMHILASHSDSPCFKIKEHPELETEGHYIRLNVERYGGMILAPWLDRPLSVAGRVIVKDADNRNIHHELVNIDRDLVLIRIWPST